MEKISNFFCSSKDSSKKPRLPILVLKQSPTSGFISKISTPNFSPILTKTHSEAITAFNQSLFPIVIAALGIMQDLSDHYNPLLTEIRKKSKACFIIIFSQTACNNAKTREICFDNGANMVTNCLDSLSNVLSQIYNQISNPGQLTCPICLLANLSEDSLWYHLPLYHINDENIKTVCPLCKNTTKPNLQVLFLFYFLIYD